MEITQHIPYIALASGAPREGKSHYIEYAIRKGFEDDDFAYGVTFFGIQKEGLEYIEGNRTIQPYSIANLSKFISFQSKVRKPCFVHFHDCASLVDWSSAFVRAFVTAYRHLNIRMFIDVQYVKMIPPTIRSCVSRAYMFRGLNKESVDALYESFGQSTCDDQGKTTSHGEFSQLLESSTGNFYMVVWDYTNTTTKPKMYCERAPAQLPTNTVEFGDDVDLAPIQCELDIGAAIEEALPASEKLRRSRAEKAAGKREHDSHAPTAPKRARVAEPTPLVFDISDTELDEEEEEPATGSSGRYVPVGGDGGEAEDDDFVLPELANRRMSKTAQVKRHIRGWIRAFERKLDIPIPPDWETLPYEDMVELLNDIRWDVKCRGRGRETIAFGYNMALKLIEGVAPMTPLKLEGLSQIASTTSANEAQDLKADIDECITEISLENEAFAVSDPYYRLAFSVGQAALSLHQFNSSNSANAYAKQVDEDLASRYSEL